MANSRGHYHLVHLWNTFPQTISKQNSPQLFSLIINIHGRDIPLGYTGNYSNVWLLPFLLCNYISSPGAIGYMHINIALGWNAFSERIRGSGIIKVVELSENDWTDFGLTRLYFRLIVMCLEKGIRIVWVQKEPSDGQKHPVYQWEATAIFSHLNFSFKREEPPWILWWGALKSSLRFWITLANSRAGLFLLTKIKVWCQNNNWKHYKTGVLASAMHFCQPVKHKEHSHVF